MTTSCPLAASGSAVVKPRSVSFRDNDDDNFNSNSVEVAETRTKHGRAEGKTFGFIAGMTLLACCSYHVYGTCSRSLPECPLLSRGLQAQPEPRCLLLQSEQEPRMLPVRIPVQRSFCATLWRRLRWRRRVRHWRSAESVAVITVTAVYLPTRIFGGAIKPQPPPPRALYER